MAKIVGLPKLSPTMEEGTLAKWAKKEGDEIGIDDLVAEIETDKATMEWRAFDKGVLLKMLVPEGTTLKPDQPVAIIGARGDDISSLLAQVGGGTSSAPASPAPPGAPGAAPAASLAPESAARSTAAPASPIAAAPPARSRTAGGNASSSTGAPARAWGESPAIASPARALADGVVASPAASSFASPAARAAEGRVLASPLVRKLAREHDVELAGVRGSGPGGRIVKRDLDATLASAPAAGASAPPALSGSVERLPPVAVKLSQMRKTIARRLTESKQSVPHFYLTIDVDAEPILEARARINEDLEKDKEKISVNDLLIKACAAALRRVPAVNASFGGDQIFRHQVVDVSVAVAIPDGLVTPVVRDADRKGVREIAREVRDLAARAREKKLKPEEMSGGTFSISNLGMYGIEDFSAVINPPEGAILAIGAVREEPVVRGGAIVPGKRLRMTLSCDHRVIDGATGAEWLAALRRVLESPVTMLM